ncbi:hypothetical protein [Amycolatopsis nigrescens]|uniref:hypothetical protein n=1 Tax=Amycolatopsis nigrescens TaxID=381445 RepID=UPI00035C2E21|nr:hypothetical protein [Amycolatopsis nigrescens]
MPIPRYGRTVVAVNQLPTAEAQPPVTRAVQVRQPACQAHRGQGRHRVRPTPDWVRLVERLVFGQRVNPTWRAALLMVIGGLVATLIALAGAVGLVGTAASFLLLTLVRLSNPNALPQAPRL